MSNKSERYHSWDNFLSLHKSQFESMKLPKYLWKGVHQKLYSPKFIADEKAFEIKHVSEGSFDLRAVEAQRKWGNVYIIPHIFVGTKGNIIKQLREDKELVERLWKMLDMEAIIIKGEEEAAATAAAKAAAAPTPRPAPLHQDADPKMVELLMEHINCTKERAIQALEASHNDFIEALNNCEDHPELRQMEEDVNAYLNNKYAGADQADIAPAAKKTDEQPKNVLTEKEKYEQKIHTLYEALFALNYVGSYMVMEPRGPKSTITGPPRPEEIVTRYYVNDEFGSAVQFSQTANVKMAHLVCITQGNIGYTLLWPEANIAAGESLLRAPVPKVSKP